MCVQHVSQVTAPPAAPLPRLPNLSVPVCMCACISMCVTCKRHGRSTGPTCLPVSVAFCLGSPLCSWHIVLYSWGPHPPTAVS